MKNTGDLEYKNFNNMDKDYKLQTAEEMLETKTGICWDQVEFERHIFEKIIKIPVKTYYFVQNQNTEDMATHTILVYQENDKFYYFENAFQENRGIYSHDSLDDVFKFVSINMREKQNDNGIKIYKYNKPESGITSTKYLDFIEKKENIVREFK